VPFSTKAPPVLEDLLPILYHAEKALKVNAVDHRQYQEQPLQQDMVI
jgi:hypothetical protein